MPDLSRPLRLIVIKHPRVCLAVTLLLAALIIWRIAVFTERHQLDQIRRTGESRISLYTGSLKDTLEKYRQVPYLLSRDIRIRNLLKGSQAPVKVNPHLEDFALTADALIFVLDSTGNTVASSNWRTKQSLIGTNFAFRPYFQDAREGKLGGYYAVGFKTRKPGFFISYPVLENGRLLGVVVVKAYLEKLENIWRESGETIIVSDSFGVLFLSSRPEWQYKSLRPLPLQTASRLRQVQYLQRPLTTLEMERQATEGGNILRLDNISFLEQSLQLVEYGWRIHYLTDLTPITIIVRLAMVTATVVFAAVFLILLYLRERRQKLLSRQEAREAKAIKQLNELLKQEINQHKETERTLQQAQKELFQAGKLAALGRMSAAIAHELNQPVTAIRTFIASCKIFIERQQADKVVDNLEFIDRLTERMSNITGQLKTFARKSKSRLEPVDLAEVIDRTLTFIGPQLDQNGVTLTKDLPARGKAIVLGNAMQLEQVMNNLVHNGLDAMKASNKKCFRIHLGLEGHRALLSCHDSGPGISEEAQEFLFDPFYTTKDIGEGLGLGLSISYGIIREMDGSIKAENHPEGGALFTLYLPLADSFNQKSKEDSKK